MANRQTVNKSTAGAISDTEHEHTRVTVKNGAKKPGKSGVSASKMVELEGRDSPSEPPSEQAFGLRRMSFLLPETLAKEFGERGGAAWLALILRADERAETPRQIAAVPVTVDHGIRPEANTAKPDDHMHCGRRRAGMHY